MLVRTIAPLARAIIAVVAVFLLATVPALALNDNPSTPRTLNAGNNSVSESLVGTPGGAYRYFQFSYQGGNAPALVQLTFHPGYGNTGKQAFGFNIYGPSSLSFAGQPTGTNGSDGSSTAQYTVVNPAAMSLMVQVYNYTNGLEVWYTLSVSGLSGGSAAAVTTATNTTPQQAVTVTTVNAALGGTITGNSQGNFQYYTLNYPGGHTPLTITMNASPSYNANGEAYGFNVYEPGTNGNGPTLVASGVQSAKDPNSETLTATISARSAVTYQLQVFNYWAGVAVSFGVTTTGLAGTTVAASGNTDGSHAFVLNSATPGATETIVGDHGGSFNYFVIAYPGNNSQLSVSMTEHSNGSAPSSNVGFNVYKGSTLVATINPTDDGTGVISGDWNFSDPSAATFGIQVFNYAQGASMSYTLYQVGSQ